MRVAFASFNRKADNLDEFSKRLFGIVTASDDITDIRLHEQESNVIVEIQSEENKTDKVKQHLKAVILAATSSIAERIGEIVAKSPETQFIIRTLFFHESQRAFAVVVAVDAVEAKRGAEHSDISGKETQKKKQGKRTHRKPDSGAEGSSLS